MDPLKPDSPSPVEIGLITMALPMIILSTVGDFVCQWERWNDRSNSSLDYRCNRSIDLDLDARTLISTSTSCRRSNNIRLEHSRPYSMSWWIDDGMELGSGLCHTHLKPDWSPAWPARIQEQHCYARSYSKSRRWWSKHGRTDPLHTGTGDEWSKDENVPNGLSGWGELPSRFAHHFPCVFFLPRQRIHDRLEFIGGRFVCSLLIAQRSISLSQFVASSNDELLATYGKINNDLVAFVSELPLLDWHSLQLQASALARLTRPSNPMTGTALVRTNPSLFRFTLERELERSSRSVPSAGLHTPILGQPNTGRRPLGNSGVSCRLSQQCHDGKEWEETSIEDNGSFRLSTGHCKDECLFSVWTGRKPMTYLWITTPIWNWNGLIYVSVLVGCLFWNQRCLLIDLFADGNDFSSNTIEKNRYRYYRQQLATRVHQQRNEVFSFLSLALNANLTLNQSKIITRPSVEMIMEKVPTQLILNRSITLFNDTTVRILLNLTGHTSVTLRVCFSPSLKREILSIPRSFGNLWPRLAWIIWPRTRSSLAWCRCPSSMKMEIGFLFKPTIHTR